MHWICARVRVFGSLCALPSFLHKGGQARAAPALKTTLSLFPVPVPSEGPVQASCRLPGLSGGGRCSQLSFYPCEKPQSRGGAEGPLVRLGEAWVALARSETPERG